MKFAIEIKPVAKKQLKKLDKKQRDRIIDKIYLLSENPYPPSSKPLKGRDDRSLRVGKYRVVYDIFEDRLVVLVLGVGHRREVYRK